MMAGSQPGQLGGDQQRELKLICMNNLLAATDFRIYFKDLLSRFVLVNSGFVAAYTPGRTAEELLGKTDFDVFSYSHAYAARIDEQEIMRTGQPIIGKMERETYKDRADAWVMSTKLPLRDERGRIIGTFGISRDVTAQMTTRSSQS
jgi:PAS domain S-box-containing protein